MHNVGIIHRDIKLKNVMISEGGDLQICDFGLAKWLGRREFTGTICGTLAYMAPEIARGEKYCHAVDFWSLGVLVYDLAFLRHPFPKVSDHESLARLFDDEKRVVEAVMQERRHSDERINHLLESLLQYNPFEREASREVIAQLYGELYSTDQLLVEGRPSFLETLSSPRKQ